MVEQSQGNPTWERLAAAGGVLACCLAVALSSYWILDGWTKLDSSRSFLFLIPIAPVFVLNVWNLWRAWRQPKEPIYVEFGPTMGLVYAVITFICVPYAVSILVTLVRSQTRTVMYNHQKDLGLAIEAYNGTLNEIPPPWSLTKDGQPGLSWRVALLPYLGEKALYDEFHHDEAWDSPHNIQLLDRMPAVYRDPGRSASRTHTRLRVFVGPNTVFPEPGELPKGTRRPTIQEIADGSSNTILIVEAAEAVPWTQPEGLRIQPDGTLPSLGYVTPRGFYVLAGDGSVRLLPRDVDADNFRSLIDPADGKKGEFP